ncbi:MAG TPA: hypothetical protein VLE27_07550 [Thermoanaerobaculia bacterium]|nr:hypothetical protein [Thermoanaerobaculia bacterium]
MEPRQLSHYTEGEYAALDAPDAWHVISLAFFTAALGARYLVRLLPAAPFPRTLLPGLAVLLFATLGLLCGFLGMRNPRGRGVAKIGVFLNATALLLGLLATAAFFYILPG